MPGRSRLRLWAMVTVQSAASNSWAIGLPIRLDRPTTTACLPVRSPRASLSSSMQPTGVQEVRAGSPLARRPALVTVRPSTSLSGEIAATIRAWLRWSGTGNCTSRPWIAGSAFSFATSASTSASLASAGSLWVSECIPAARDWTPLLRT